MDTEGYTLIKGKHGARFMKNNRFVKYSDVPEEIRTKLEAGATVVEFDPKKCIFCGGFATETRFVNLQTIALCDADYYDKNVGQIVQRIREITNGQSDVKEPSSQESSSGQGSGEEGQELQEDRS